MAAPHPRVISSTRFTVPPSAGQRESPPSLAPGPVGLDKAAEELELHEALQGSGGACRRHWKGRWHKVKMEPHLTSPRDAQPERAIGR